MIELGGITLVSMLLSKNIYLGVIPPIFYLIGEQYFQGKEWALTGLIVVFLGSVINPFIHKIGR